MDKIVSEIIEFWLGPSEGSPEAALARKDWWYAGGTPVDDEIRARFGEHVSQACQRQLLDWNTTPEGALALVLLLDQFTRNIYRGTPDAYAGDPCAFDIVQEAIAKGLDRTLHPVSRIWLYHPFHHSESIEQQDKGLSLLDDIKAGAPAPWHPYVERSITGWTRHRNIVAQFGRFPHRNHVLGRASTEDEKTFLASDGESFGQTTK
ncbi:MAG: hypothetical protein ACI89J_002202 [Hyphomicrobiaceae bacterium]